MTKHVVTPLIDRILARLEPDENGCWVWQGARTYGYGVVGLGRRGEGTAQTHRALWQLAIGPVPDGLHLDHICRNRACANPMHLEPVTQQENIRRGVEYRRATKA